MSLATALYWRREILLLKRPCRWKVEDGDVPEGLAANQLGNPADRCSPSFGSIFLPLCIASAASLVFEKEV